MTDPERTAAKLAISLFGPFTVLVNGAPLPRLHSRKQEALIALLALRHNRPVERAWLAGMLWPDASASQGLATLRRYLTDLRRVLGPEARRLCSPTVSSLALDLTGAVVDLLLFDWAVAQSGGASLDQAVDLYRGPLLEGWIEEWVFEERSCREESVLGALEKLTAGALARDDLGAAERYLRRAVAIDPLRESAQRGLMEIQARGGSYAGALLTYRELCERLYKELNSAPHPQTTALFQQLRAEAREKGVTGRGPRTSNRQASLTQITRAGVGGLSAPARDHQPQRGTQRGGVTSKTVFLAPSPGRSVAELPIPPTPLIGREWEMETLHGLLRDGPRLLTLTGPAGTGKTRLALEVAANLRDHVADGIFFVDLAPLRDPSLVVAAVAQALGVREASDVPLLASLKRVLREKQLVLLLDNFEHLLDAATAVAELFQGALRLKVLVTSRAPLRLRGEQEFPVLPLPVPDRNGTLTVEALSRCPSVALFTQRAMSVKSEFVVTAEEAPAVAEICCRLDGLPLAIELAAVRTKLLPPRALLARLGKRLDLLTDGARDLPARQRTLRDAIAWSHDLLNEGEQRLFRRLSVFVGGCTLEAVEAVCDSKVECEGVRPLGMPVLDGVASLVDKSLVRQVEGINGEPRFQMLETIREYGLECLVKSGEERAVRRQHAAYFTRFAEETGVKLFGAGEAVWLDQLEREHNNLRAALDWLTEHGEAEASLWLAARLRRLWVVRGYWSEARERLVGLLALTGAAARTGARAQALYTVGLLAWRQSDLEAARAFQEESLAIYRELGDRHGIANSLGGLGLVVRGQGDYATACRLFEEALAINRALGDQVLQAANLHWLGYMAVAEGDYAGAKTFFEEALAIDQETGHRGRASFRALGELALTQGDYAAARQIFEAALSAARELKDKLDSARCLKGLGDVASGQGDCETAQALYAESLTLCGELGFKPGIAWLLQEFAGRAAARGEPERAARLLGAAAPLIETIGDRFEPTLWHPADHDVSAVRARMSEKAFAAAWAQGRAMTLDQATRYALAGPSGDTAPQ
jgi:predicted ATPase/DNA-binding SARP family transcriptional activator